MTKFVFKKNTKRAFLLLLCASMILVAFPMASVSVSASEAPAEEQSEYVEVLRVIDDIKYGAKFTSDKLETVRVRADAVPADAIKTTGELYNKYAASTILVGDFLTPAKLLDKRPVDATDEEEDEDEYEEAPSKKKQASRNKGWFRRMLEGDDEDDEEEDEDDYEEPQPKKKGLARFFSFTSSDDDDEEYGDEEEE